MAFKLLTWALFLALVVALFSQPLRVRSQSGDVELDEEIEVVDDDEDVGIDGDLADFGGAKVQQRQLGAHPLVQTFVHFPDHNESDFRFTQGEDVVMLVGISNQSPDTYFNVSHIGAQFHSPYDFSYYIQNFTVREMESIVGPGQETTIEYRFHADANLEPIDFQLSAWVLYNSSRGITYQSTIFNETVELIEASQPWTVTSVFNYILFLSGLGVIGYVGYHLSQGQQGKKKRTRRAVPQTAEEKEIVEKSWEAQIYKPSQKSKAIRRDRPGSKKGSKKSDSKKSNKSENSQNDSE